MNLHQAYLWIGPEEELQKRAVSLVQRWLCKNNSCGRCSDCVSIVEQRHYALTWLVPENYYTLKQLERLFTTVCFSLNPGDHHFIVIERADLLNSSSANSLLKSLEEPPPGYHYILLAPRKEGILPTIASRCVIEVSASVDPVLHRLVPYFTEFQFSRATELMKEIQKERVPEKEIDQLLDACMHYWHTQLKQALTDGDTGKARQARSVGRVIEQAREKPPMPGSSKLFLKNLFLRVTLAM